MRTTLAVGIFLLAACSTPEEERRPKLEQELYVAYGKSVTIESEGLTLTFKEINEDSRCPTGAQCPWGGQATITMELSKAESEPQSFALTLPSPNGYFVAPYAVTLLELNPYPTTVDYPAPEEYVATLVIYKSDP